MKTSSELTSSIFEFLNENSKYAVLRNYEGLPLNNISRDIDILLEKKEFLKIESSIIKIIIASEFKITTLYRSEKISTYVCAALSNGVIELVQFDFFFNTSLFGILLLDTTSVLNSKKFNGAIFHVSKEYEFLDKYIQLKFLNKTYPQKYKALEDVMRKNRLLPNILKVTFGITNFTELENITTSNLRRRILLQNFKVKPFEQILLLILFFWNYFRNKLAYKGFSIGFTGPDGAGKTTVINAIVKELSQVYSDIQLLHFRPTVIPNLGEAAQKTKLKSKLDLDYSKPHRGSQTSKTNSFIRLLYYSIDYIIGYFFKIRPFLVRRSVVIFDRYFTDIIADSRRSRIFLNPKILYWFGKVFIPKLDYNILLTAHKDIILARKQELTAEGIDNINEKLNYLSEKRDYYLVFNERTYEEAVQKILTVIFEKQHQINLKRIIK